MTEYLIRAKLEFDWDFEPVGKDERLRRPYGLPVKIGPFQLNESPNAEFYLDREAQVELDQTSQAHPDWRYPVSLLYFERKLQVPTNSPPYAKANETFEHLEWLLRLFQPGGISVRRHEHLFRVQEQKFQPIVYFTGHPVPPVPAPLYERPPYPFGDDVLDSFIKFFDEYWCVLEENPPYTTAALTRFNSSYEKHRIADRLIDLVIALEALFGDGELGSISYKVAMRCACWLHPPGKERLDAFTLIKKFYDMRSKVVHGGQKASPSEDQVDQLEGIVRAILVKCLDRVASQAGSFDYCHGSRPSNLRAPLGCQATFLMAAAMLVAPLSRRIFSATFLRAAIICGAEPVRTWEASSPMVTSLT